MNSGKKKQESDVNLVAIDSMVQAKVSSTLCTSKGRASLRCRTFLLLHGLTDFPLLSISILVLSPFTFWHVQPGPSIPAYCPLCIHTKPLKDLS